MGWRAERLSPVGVGDQGVQPVGEIVEASLISLTAEVPTDRLYLTPAFGSIIRAEHPGAGQVIYAVVVSAETASIEPNRRATAFWQSEADLRQSQPQIFELLSTHFTAIIVAHRSEDGCLSLRLPPRPPRVHGFVYECDPGEVRELTGRPGLFRTLLEAPVPSPDELVAAALHVSAGKHLASLLRDDYPRLQAIIRKVM
jgi:hypothetical protein